MYDYGYIITASWAVFMVLWVIGSFTAKRDVSNRYPSGVFWLSRFVLIVLILVLVSQGGFRNAVADILLFNLGVTAGWIGAALTIIGLVCAIWARFYLGRNWSSHPTHKEDHELITNGPYAYVRHPIYTGVLLALLGSALTGSIFGILLFIISIVFCLRIGKEEKIMLDLFPNDYPAYQRRTKRLIPFVW